ncbi:glycoside hydrolase family 95-like protein [uncultured Draconibacterium sp.]|uniref:glycosyl hydrolase family 95 catalytic domain-containing protein n=1 Tax=uncultured Draconibacterium sp. TaxID=1573823 RepID=UPI002AA88E3B|nr:hypothetical protein [uncultured Draconibacterium sp.]
MKYIDIRLFAIVILTLIGFACTPKENEVKLDVDWKTFLGKHDMVWNPLTYSEKPDYWEKRNMKHHHNWHEGAFTGNGEIGAMIYKETPERLRFQLGRYDVNSHRKVEKIDWTVPRLLIGDFLLQPKGTIENESMRLHLWDAEVTGNIKTDKGTIEWRSFTHADDMTIVVELRASEGERETLLQWRPESGISPRWWYSDDSANVSVEMPPLPELNQIDGANVSVQKFVETGEFAVAWKEQQIKPGHKIYYISIANSYPENNAKEKALDWVTKSQAKEFESFINEHRSFWHKYYSQSFVSLSDKKWEGFYWIQMYKLASATRSDRELIDNSGPWLPKSPWAGVWWNLNVQLSYSPLYTSNRLNLAESLVNQIHSHKDVFINHNVPDSLKGKNCALMDRCSDLTFRTEPEFLELGNLTWVLFTMHRHYRHSMDKEMLKEKIYPLLKANINSYLHFMYLGDDGKLHLPPTHSPEYGRSLKVQDANYALALFRWGCQTLIEINEVLGLNDELQSKWEYVLENLVEAPKNENGYMVGHDTPFAMSHRHYSHLFEIYPLHLIDLEDPANADLINRSIEHWIGFKGALAGYSYSGSSSMASYMGDGEKALEYLEGFFPYMCPNTMYVEAGQVIETPLSCAESIHNMLLQSWGDRIKVFPAVSDKWKDVSFDKLLAEGAFEVSAVRTNGSTEFVKIKSLAGGPLKIEPNINGKIQASGKREFNISELEEGIYEIDLQKEEEVLLYAEKVLPDLKISSVQGDTIFYNFFGPNSLNEKEQKQLHDPK